MVCKVARTLPQTNSNKCRGKASVRSGGPSSSLCHPPNSRRRKKWQRKSHPASRMRWQPCLILIFARFPRWNFSWIKRGRMLWTWLISFWFIFSWSSTLWISSSWWVLKYLSRPLRWKSWKPWKLISKASSRSSKRISRRFSPSSRRWNRTKRTRRSSVNCPRKSTRFLSSLRRELGILLINLRI